MVVAVDEDRGLYFSRSMIPYDRAGTGRVQYFKHLGLYAYSAAALEAFSRLPVSQLEVEESLEQLRFLHNGIPMVVLETGEDTIGVDTEDDLQKVEAYFRERGIRIPAS